MSVERDPSGDDLILVTGGAGFIGSHLVADLAKAGWRIVVSDLLRSGDKWRNLVSSPLHDLIRPDALFGWLARHGDKLAAIVHMGAISSTTEKDIDRLVEANVRLTLDLWQWCAANGTRFIYASSAATYGDGSTGFSDDESPAALAALRPLNAYGWSKHLVDRRVVDDMVRGQPTPLQWAGLKFFNVYGPNEAHKGDMQSLVSKIYPAVQAGGAVTLFKSHRPTTPMGGSCGISSMSRTALRSSAGCCGTRWPMACSMSAPALRGAFSTWSQQSARWSDAGRMSGSSIFPSSCASNTNISLGRTSRSCAPPASMIPFIRSRTG